MKYDGSKNADGVFQRIINQIPPHTVSIESHFGSGAITRRKLPALLNYGIELDPITIAAVQPWLSVVDVTLIQGDALFWLPTLVHCLGVAAEDVFVFMDPPYMMETRSWKGDLYRCEFGTVEQHTKLLDIVKTLPATVMLCGYWSELYADMLSGWRTLSYTAMTHRGPRTEWLWMNYRDPEVLHDYRYLGRDNTDRQRIKRKIERRVRILNELPPLERNAILHALQELKPPASSGSREALNGCTVDRV